MNLCASEEAVSVASRDDTPDRCGLSASDPFAGVDDFSIAILLWGATTNGRLSFL